jgi:glycosyltransferase involved in cell wall biosynthesis
MSNPGASASPTARPGPSRPEAIPWARRDRLRLLVLASRVPEREGRADQRTVYRFLEFMAARGHRLHLIALDSWDSPVASSRALEELCERVEIFPQARARALWQALRGLGAGYPLQVGGLWNSHAAHAVRRALEHREVDLIYAHLIRTAEYVRHDRGVPAVLAMQIAQSLNLQRMVRYRRGLGGRLFYRLELALVRRYEPAVARDFERCVVISGHDRAAIGLARGQTWLVPHGVDAEQFRPVLEPPAEEGPVTFSGVLDTATNVEAVQWLLRAIWPRVQSMAPQARLRLVGRAPVAAIRRLAAAAGAELVASPQTIVPYLREASLAVAPVRIAAGLQNKVLEAMACGVAVVATPQANEGIGARPEREIVLAQSAAEFAGAIVGLLRDPRRRAELGGRGRALIERRWSWDYHW